MSGRSGFRVQVEDTGWESRGGYMEAKNRKLQQQFDEDTESRSQVSSIFRGVAIQVNGWTVPSADELKIIMSKNGGKYHMYYSRSKTTHVIASNLPQAKRKELRPDQKVVKPQWITDSLKANQLLPIDQYLVVPLEDAAQNTITSILGKRKSSYSDSKNESTISKDVATTSAHLEDDAQDGGKSVKHSLTNIERDKTPRSTSRTICPTTDSNFLSEFYSHSRLHFLSTWKMELKEYVRSLQSEESLKEIPLTGYQNLLKIAKTEGCEPVDHGRAVLHIDMDCFFVSVGLKSRPELCGLPVAVTHSTGTGITSERPDADPEFEAKFYEKKFGTSSKLHEGSSVRSNHSSSSLGPGYSASEIASCSYEARAVGVRNGMFMGKAKELCPELRVIPYDFEAYRRASDQLYSTLATFTRHIEAVSCDEALVDLTKLVKETNLPPLRVASCIRHAVKEATGCNASAGVAPNIALAKMATRRAKPDGEFEVTLEQAKEFMKSLPVKDLPGVGHSTASRLQEMGLSTCEDLQNHPVKDLQQEFGGKTGQKLHDMSCGIDNREVEIEKERKSVSAEVNYGIRLSDEEEAKTFLQNLAKEVTNRLNSAGMRGKRITLKVMVRRSDAPKESTKFGGHGICDSFSRSSQISLKNKGDLYEGDCSAIYGAAWTILSSLELNVSDLRGIGIQVTQLQSADSSSVSSNVESSSAAFLKKFMVKKSEISTSKDQTNADDVSVSTCNVRESEDIIIDDEDKSEPKREGEALNLSFLDALPPELRKEVEENMKQQREALEKNFLKNEDSNESTGPTTQADEIPSRPTSNVLFCGQGKLSTGNKTVQQTGPSTSRGRGKRGAKSKGTKPSSSRTLSRKTRNSDTSPTKLITDMFPVTYSPKKTSSAKSSPALKQKMSPARSLVLKNLALAATKAKRKLISIREEDIVEIEDSDEEIAERINIEELPQETNAKSIPTLGGAFKVEEIRQVLTEWINAYTKSGPLECDIDDFISFLIKTATELRDLEKVNLTLRSFRRKLVTALQKCDLQDPCYCCWVDAYNKVCDCIQDAVRKSYRGGELNLLPL